MFWLTFPYHKSHIILGRDGTARYPRIARIRGHLTSFFLYRWIIPCSDHVFVQSETMAKDFCAHGADPNKLTAIVTGIDLGGVTPLIPGAKARSSALTVVYLGTLAAGRRLDVLVDMLAELKRGGIAIRLLFIGDGDSPDDRRLLEDRAAELNVSSQMEITGFLPRNEALQLACTGDIALSPFFPSPIFDCASPTKLVEYLALGLPVVANSHPDQSLVLRESRAGVCVPWGARYFARAVRWLAQRDRKELAEMGLRGQAWVHRHRSYAGIADDFERGCRVALAKRRGEGR
jgi:glycosyltransferase involved in cell wall biosynthesis